MTKRKKITRIIPINLKRRRDKLLAYYGALFATYTPFKLVEPFEAHDAADYPTSHDVRDAAMVEFPFWSNLHDDWLREYGKRGTLCTNWSMQSVLRKISELPQDELAVMCTDGVPFTRNFYDMRTEIAYMPDFDIFQLWHWDSDVFPRPAHFATLVEGYEERLSWGLGGAGDGCFILTPYGASRILEWCESLPYHILEHLIHVKSLENPPGCISPLYPYSWVRPHIVLEPFFGEPDSERERLDNTEEK